MSSMFEQPLYEFEPAPAPHDESDLFHDYEVKGWISSPGLVKILGISAVANIVALLVFAQTSLLTMKGCDSPLVGSVCQVLDTVYVGSLLFGTDREYVDAAYDKIDLGDSDITYVDVSKVTPPLDYPAGYFQIANPEETAMLGEFTSPSELFSHGIPGIPNGMPLSEPSTGSSLFDTQPNIPKSNPNVIDEGSLPKGNLNGGGVYWPTPARLKKGKRQPLASANPEDTSGFPTGLDPNTVAEKHSPSPSTSPTPQPTVEPTGPVADVELNKRPFIDLATTLNGLLDKKMVNLETPFKITATGKLDKNGKLDRKSFVYREALSPDPRMIEVIKEAIEAMNESNYLQYLTMLSGKDLSFQIYQDDQRVVAVIQSEFETDKRANTISSLLNAYINGKKQAKEAPDASQNDKDDLVLLQNARVEPQGKKLAISFMIPKGELQTMIQRKLAEQKAQPKPENTTGVTQKPVDPAVK